MSTQPGPARLDIPLDCPGRTVGALRLPWSHDRSAYGQIVVPVVVIKNGHGPTALLSAGIHGDEYEGQIVLGRLARTLRPETIRGRLILVPCANPAASLAGRRTSPVDDGNLARLFPGDPHGSPSSQLAEGIGRLLLSEADFLVDFHSGGSTLDYVPCAFGRLPPDPALADRVLDLLIAFGAPVTVVVRRPEARGTLVAEALNRGVVAMATELAGGGGVTTRTIALAEQGLARVLAHTGILPAKGPPTQTRLLAVEAEHFVRAPGRGLFEPMFTLGQDVAAGDVAGRLSNPERPDRSPEEIAFATGGTAICRRVPAMAEPGDVLVHLGQDVDRATLLSR